ncbi:hypothetical protein K7X08_027188 [Anisodus acutangulus]|uniref:DUF1995 domain-containing protein n=1 Tax=Anisodus acutangulus TaxID=402998 RepID=A0A9Q1RI05_9SOLA|nr:hypothetical protein K7X08_027188 [Anisodus acutangulus]
MASNLLKFNTQSIQTSHPLFHFKLNKLPYTTSSLNSLGSTQQLNYLYLSVCFTKPMSQFSPIQCSLSSPTPPTTKEDAIFQAKFSLLSTLEKPLNNPKLVGRLKKLKQPRFRVEIPVVDDSPSALSQLALDIFGNIPLKRKGPKIKILLLWPNQSLTQAAQTAFEKKYPNPIVDNNTNNVPSVIPQVASGESRVYADFTSDLGGRDVVSNPIIENLDISSVTDGDISSVDVLVFMAPEASRLTIVKEIADVLYPKPVVMFNPTWGFDEESNFGELSGFVSSFEVVYSFMGLEVRGILSNRKGVMFKCVRDGVLSGENSKWYVFVEEDGELKVVSRFKTRPSIVEVENVLYNLMAMNSPITKSAKFFKDLVSNVRGKK